MPLRVIPHKPTGGLTITGTVAGTRVRRRAQSNNPKLAAEEAATIEANLLRAAWHGERRGSRTFAEAVTAYLEAALRSESTKARSRKLLLALGTTRLADIDQGTVVRLRKQVLTPNASPATRDHRSAAGRAAPRPQARLVRCACVRYPASTGGADAVSTPPRG